MGILALRSAEPGKVCAKRWRADGNVEPYGSIVWWRPSEASKVRSIESLCAVLERLETRRDICLVRGSLAPDWDGRPIRRALYGDRAGLVDGDRSWLCCDLDTLEPPTDLRERLIADRESGLELAARWAQGQLPEWMQGVTMVAQWSQSAGRDRYARAKLHLWYWLDRPVCCASLAAWASSIPVLDPAVCRPVQPIYSAAPIIEDGWLDGPSRRTVLVRGGQDVARVPGEILSLARWSSMRAAEETKRRERAARQAEADRYRSPLARDARRARLMGGVTRRVLDAMAAAPESRRHATLIRGAIAIVMRAGELGMDASEDLRALADVARARLPADRATEPDEVIRYAQSIA